MFEKETKVPWSKVQKQDGVTDEEKSEETIKEESRGRRFVTSLSP